MGYKDCKLRRSWLPPQDCPGIYEPVLLNPCGFLLDHAINVFTSPDLVNWRFSGEALPVGSRPEGIYFRPKVIYNALTQLYVLWVNWLPVSKTHLTTPLLAYPHAAYLVATSPTPAGPFTVVREQASTRYTGGGDFSILVVGSEAYLAYGAWENHHSISIEKLDDTFTESTKVNTSLLSPEGNEAPVLMERRGWFYLLYGQTCCFCRDGDGVHVLVSQHPMGPWNDTGLDIGKPPAGRGRSFSNSQQSFVINAVTPAGNVSVWCGDQWGSSPDGLKSHDLQYWVPMEWDEDAQPPLPRRLRLVDSFVLNLTHAAAE
eukprot:EG_transcript_14053